VASAFLGGISRDRFGTVLADILDHFRHHHRPRWPAELRLPWRGRGRPLT
jgi:hypothetical protein